MKLTKMSSGNTIAQPSICAVSSLSLNKPDSGSAVAVRALSHFFRIADPAAKAEGTVCAIDDVSLDIPERRFVAIVGPSGCGKTTLLNIIAGLEPVQVGAARVCGAPAQSGNPRIAFMQARDALLPWRSALGNAAFGLEVRGAPAAQRRAVAGVMLQRVGLGSFVNARPRQLSQGMRQRVALARTFALDSPVLLMDEPFGALDAQTKQQLQSVLLELWEQDRRTVVLVTHDLQEAIGLSDQVVVMSARPGRIKAIFDVDLPRPRLVKELIGTPAFTSLYLQVRTEVDETRQ